MSIKAMTWAWELSDLPQRETLVLLALADAANDEGISWPSRETLARKARCTVRTVARALNTLRDVGLIEIIPQTSPDGRKPSLYRVSVGMDFSAELLQRDKMSLWGSPDEDDPVDNPTFPHETGKGTNCPLGSETPTQEDTGGKKITSSVLLLPIKDLTQKNHHPSPQPPTARSGGVDGSEGMDNFPSPKRAGAARRPDPEVVAATSLAAKCLPESLRAMDTRGLLEVASLLRERLDAGWKPAEIRALMGAPLPEKTRRIAGVVAFRLRQFIEPENAPASLRKAVSTPAEPEPTAAETAWSELMGTYYDRDRVAYPDSSKIDRVKRVGAAMRADGLDEATWITAFNSAPTSPHKTTHRPNWATAASQSAEPRQNVPRPTLNASRPSQGRTAPPVVTYPSKGHWKPEPAQQTAFGNEIVNPF